MKKHQILFLLMSALFLSGSMLVLGMQPALLENDVLSSPMAEDGIFLFDEAVPLADLPEDATETPEALYEGLDETQTAYVDEVLLLVNEARTEAGVPTLTLDPALRKAAQVRAAECVGTFSHTRPNGTSYKTAITEAGVESGYTGENVATGHTSAQQVVSRWLRSDGHRKNILNANYTRIGIGLEKNSGNRYGGYAWVQLFAK